ARDPAGVIQRQPAPGQAQPAPVSAPAGPRPWKEVWTDLRFANISDTARVPALTQELLDAADAPRFDSDFLEEGPNAVEWLENNGNSGAADRLLDAVRRHFAFAFGVDR